MASQAVRPIRLSRRAVRSAQLRTEHAACERTRYRPLEQQHCEPHRGYRAVARVSRHRSMVGARRVMGQHARARLCGTVSTSSQRDHFVRRHHRTAQGVRLVVSRRPGRLFPAQWERLREALPPADARATSSRLTIDGSSSIPIPRSADKPRWLGARGSPRRWPGHRRMVYLRDLRSRLWMAFARIVTHYVRRNAWLEDGILFRDAGCDRRHSWHHGEWAFRSSGADRMGMGLNRVWPRAKLVIVDDAGHDASNASITAELVRATDRFANPEKTSNSEVRARMLPTGLSGFPTVLRRKALFPLRCRRPDGCLRSRPLCTDGGLFSRAGRSFSV